MMAAGEGNTVCTLDGPSGGILWLQRTCAALALVITRSTTSHRHKETTEWTVSSILPAIVLGVHGGVLR